MNSVLKIFNHLTKKRKFQLSVLLLFMALTAFAEVLGVSAIFPFLAILMSPENLVENKRIANFVSLFNFSNTNELVFYLTFFFIFATILSGLMRLFLLWFQTSLSYLIGCDLGATMYRKTLYQKYEFHIGKNSSEIISGITYKSGCLVNFLIYPVLSILSSVFILSSILMILLLINPLITLITLASLIFIYLIISILSKKHLNKYSKVISTSSDKLYKALQEGLGGIREVLVGGLQEMYYKAYLEADYPFKISKAKVHIIGSAPRFIVESIGISFIAFLAYFMTNNGHGNDTLPLIGVLAFGIQRMLPLAQQLYSEWASMLGNQSSVNDAFDMLDQVIPIKSRIAKKTLLFNRKIELKNIFFRYAGSNKFILKNVNLRINKGEIIGILGPTGGGKSTLLDILMGLLEPTEGVIKIDGSILNSSNRNSWQSKIAHVPQNIYLNDASAAENIAFGKSKDSINLRRLKNSAQRAQISEYFESFDEKYDLNIGERGIKLSGGQKQRVGIARAFYKNAEFLIFDEATSALDSLTEKKVMQSIDKYRNKLTIVILAHRLSTLKNCSAIYEVKQGKVRKKGINNNLFK